MHRSTADLRSDAERIWWAGVESVLPQRLIPQFIRIDGNRLLACDETIDLRSVERIAIVGGGKAAGAMAVALENVLGTQLLIDKRVTGWVNVPADCLLATQHVRLHAARPAGVNEPRPEGVEGTRRILEIVSALNPADLCFCLLTGGGSALLPAPVAEISLEDKVRVTRLLSAAGANIDQLNTVRRHLSMVKGGRLARACRAGRLITLAISDVLGDRLDVIASGPTVPNSTTADDALAVLEDLQLIADPSLSSVVHYLQVRTVTDNSNAMTGAGPGDAVEPRASYHILGNNATAVDAAGAQSERLGHSHAMTSATTSEGPAEDVGRHLAEIALRMRGEAGPNCLISGGEPTVSLVDESRRGKGGRNQQLALAALASLGDATDIAFLSAGTDGEDGPTNAAGAVVTKEVVGAAQEKNLDPREFLARNDAYEFFHPTGGLFITGPTQTNVCDLRVVVVNRN